jgi:hypothetical protein
MDPNIFDNAYTANPNDNALNMDIEITNSVIKSLYELKGGDKYAQEKINKNRLVQLDRYYISKLQAETRVLKTIVFFCCLGLIGTLIFNNSFITSLFYTVYMGILFFIMFIIVSRDLADIFLRDNMIFDEYDYAFLNRPAVSLMTADNYYNDAELSNLPTCAS